MIAKGSIVRAGGRIGYSCLDLGEPWRKHPASAIVFQHGLGLTSAAWWPWLPILARDHPIVCIDLRGHGDSAEAWQKPDYSIDELTDDVLAVTDHIGLQSFHFVGESIGGTIGLNLALRSPKRVDSLTVCSTAFRGDMVTNVARWLDLTTREGIARWSEEFIEGRFDRGRVSADLVAWVDGLQRKLSPVVVTGIVRSLLAVDLEMALKRLATRLLLLYPLHSPFVDPRSPTALRALVPLADAIFIPGARHGVILSHWKECSVALKEFIERVDR